MLWLVLAVCVAPFAGSFLLYWFWEPEGHVNYGELIEARPLPQVPLALADGKPFALTELRGKWLLVALDGGRCEEACQKKLYYLRQLRLMQGKHMGRIERVWLMLDGENPDPKAMEAFDGTWQVRAGPELPRHFPAPDSVREHLYVVDPLGNLILRYPREADPRRIKKDLERLLKASRIG